MPRAARKSVSRCSSRSSSSSRSSCRKRHSPRDNALSLIREAFLPSVSANRFSPLRIETPPLTPIPAPPTMQLSSPSSIQPEKLIQKIEQEVKVPKQVKLKEANIAPQKPTGIFQHGIRYIMLPLHLLHLCVWGSPAQSSSETKEKKISSPKSQKTNKKPPSYPESKNPSSSSSSSSKTPSSSASSSGLSSSSSTSSKSSRMPPAKIPASTSSLTSSEQIVSVASSVPSSSSSSSVPTVKTSSLNQKNLIPRRILGEEITGDSDEMVTAAEDLDDSSNEQWSNAVSSPSMNMSIDLDGYSNFEKVSSSSTANCAMEEPMDVSIEESNFYVKRSNPKSPSRNLRANAMKNMAERTSGTSSSSSSSEDKKSIYQESSNSSVDREIASIFQKACTSSSSDDEEYGQLSGRRNNPFISRPSNFGPVRSGSRFREEISDAAIRKKRPSNLYDRLPELDLQTKRSNRSSSRSQSNEGRSVDLSKIRVSKEKPLQSSQKVIKASNQTDSAYSDEDVEMNSINESITRLQTVHMQSLQENVVEWMDQDLDYVADTEDSNHGSPLPERTRISSIGGVSSESADHGFVERVTHPRDLDSPLEGWKQISGLETSMLNDRFNPAEYRRDLSVWNKICGPERSVINAQIKPQEGRSPLEDWNEISGVQRSMPNSLIVSGKDGNALGDWKKISSLETSILNNQNLRKESRPPLGDWNKISGLHRSQLNTTTVPIKNGTPLGDWNKISGLEGSSLNDPISLKDNVAPLGDWNKISGLEGSSLNDPIALNENVAPLGDWNKISGLEGSSLNDPIALNENVTPLGDWNKISGLEGSSLKDPISLKENVAPLGNWNKISGLEGSSLDGPIALKENVTPLGDWSKISGLQTSMLNSSIVPKPNGRFLGDWNEISELGGSVNTQISFPQKTDADLSRQQAKCGTDKSNHDVQIAGRGPPGFPKIPQYPAGISCHCGNLNCFYVPLAIPAGSSTVNWVRNYTKPPTPMRHLYYEYPEFMNPPAEASTGHQSPYVLIPVPANLVCQELA